MCAERCNVDPCLSLNDELLPFLSVLSKLRLRDDRLCLFDTYDIFELCMVDRGERLRVRLRLLR